MPESSSAMDRRRSIDGGHGRSEQEFQIIDSREDTCVPNTPVLATLKPTASTPQESPPRSVLLDDLEKGEQIVELPSPISGSRFQRHFREEVCAKWADVMLLLCWFTTGFLDSTIFNGMPQRELVPGGNLMLISINSIWNVRVDADRYVTCSSLKTNSQLKHLLGNTVLFGLGASNARSTDHPYRWAKSLSSLIAFIIGCLFFSKVCKALGPLRRSTLTMSFLLQSLIILIAAAVVQKGAVEGRIDFIELEINWMQVIPIVLLSFQAPGQTCGARQLGFFETPTVVVTTMIYDFASDPDLCVAWYKNPVRNRRVAGLVLMLLGAVAGGWVTESMGQIHVALWVAAATKTAMGLAWIVWPKREQTRQWGY